MRNITIRTFRVGLASVVVALTALGGLAAMSMRPAEAAQNFVTFQSPTGNVHCLLYTEPGETHFATCELREFSGKIPKRPADCDLDWVPGASVDARGRVSVFSCQGDTNQSPDNKKLSYGKSVKSGVFTCTSAVTGVTCKVKSGRGFLVSRSVIKAY